MILFEEFFKSGSETIAGDMVVSKLEK